MKTCEDYIREQRSQLKENHQKFIQTMGVMFHINMQHREADDAQMLDNVLSGRKRADTRFVDDRVMYGSIAMTLDAYMPDIIDYAMGKNNDDLVIEHDVSHQYPMVGSGFRTESGSKTMPIGYNQHINAIDTSVVGLVIRKAPDTPEGWRIITAFPAGRPATLETGVTENKQDISYLLKHSPTYQSKEVSEIWRIGARAACRDKKLKNLHVEYFPPMFNRSEQLVVTKNEPQPGIDQPAIVMGYNQGLKPVYSAKRVEVSQLGNTTKMSIKESVDTSEIWKKNNKLQNQIMDLFRDIQNGQRPKVPKPTPYPGSKTPTRSDAVKSGGVTPSNGIQGIDLSKPAAPTGARTSQPTVQPAAQIKQPSRGPVRPTGSPKGLRSVDTPAKQSSKDETSL